MANNLSVKIGANTADLEKNIERAKKTLEQYSRSAKEAKSEIEQNVSVSNQQVNAYQRVVKQLEKVNSGTLSTIQQQKNLQNQIQELKIQWNSLTDDQKISGFGQSIAQSLKAAESELETTKQKLADVNTGASNIKPIDGKNITEGFSQEIDGLKNKVVSLGAEGSGALAPLVSTFSELGPYGMAAAAGIAAITGALQLGIEAATTFSQDAHDQIDQMKAAWDGAVTSLSVYIEQTLHLGETITSVGNNVLAVLTPLTGQTAELVNAERQYTAAQDDLGDKLDLVTIREKALKEAITEKNETLKDPKATQEAIDAANKKAENALANYQKEVDGAKNANTKVLNSIINRHAAVQHYEKMNSAAVQYILDNLSHEEMKEQAKKFNYMIKNRSKFTAQQQAIIEASHMWTQSLNDEQRRDYLSHLTKMLDLDKNYYRSKKQLETGTDIDVGLGNGNDNKGKGMSSFKVSTPKVKEKNQLQELEEQNKKIKQQTEFITKNFDKLVEQLKIQKSITENLERQKELLNIAASLDMSKFDASQLKPVSLEDIIPKTEVPLEIKPVLNQKEMDKITKEAGDKEKKRLKDQADAEKKYSDQVKQSMSSVGNAFNTLGQAIGGVGGEMLNTMGQMLGQVPAMIEAINSITNAKEGEAIASGTAEGAKAPWFMQVAVIAGLVANIIATFASIGKFANGGIIQGGSRIGDYNIARVNSGEMILNGRQQSNLFRMLDSSNIQSTNIDLGSPEVRIKGSDIYLSYHNYKKIARK